MIDLTKSFTLIGYAFARFANLTNLILSNSEAPLNINNCNYKMIFDYKEELHD
jgi:prolipoprotein diacylglyceryltransferase